MSIIEKLLEYSEGKDVRNTKVINEDGTVRDAKFADGNNLGVFKKTAITGGGYGHGDNWSNQIFDVTSNLTQEILDRIERNKTKPQGF